MAEPPAHAGRGEVPHTPRLPDPAPGDVPDEHAVEGAVARLEGRALGPGQLAVGVVERLEGQVRVEPRERVRSRCSSTTAP